jgi:hypothetical protein
MTGAQQHYGPTPGCEYDWPRTPKFTHAQFLGLAVGSPFCHIQPIEYMYILFGEQTFPSPSLELISSQNFILAYRESVGGLFQLTYYRKKLKLAENPSRISPR